MFAKLLDRFRTPQPKKPEPVEPAQKQNWADTLLEGMSEKDRTTIQTLRRSFEKRGKNQQWYYAAASTDLEPVLMAPAGTTHHLIDPVYVEHTNQFKQIISRSALAGFETAEKGSGLETTLPDGGRIIWDGQSGTTTETVPEELDVIYTNAISMEPHPKSLQNLKTHGLVVFSGRPSRAEEFINPVSAVADLRDLGFRLIRDDIQIDNYNPTGTEEMSRYTHGSKRRYHIYEKTRELTAEEQAQLYVNQVSLQLHAAVEGLIFYYRADDPVPQAADITQAMSRAVSTAVEGLDTFFQQIQHELPQGTQAYAKELFMRHVGNTFRSSDAAVKDWMWDLDSQLNDGYLSQPHNDQGAFDSNTAQLVHQVRQALQSKLIEYL